MNFKYLIEIIVIFLGIFYYYISTFFQEYTSILLLPTFILGILFAGLVMLRYLLINNITKFFLKYFGIFMLVFVASVIFNWPNILWLLLMSVPLLNMDKDTYIKIIFYLSSIMFFAVLILSFIGVLPLSYLSFNGEVEVRYGITRYSLGFDGPNQAAFSFFTILLSGMYTYGTKKIFVIAMTLITLLIGITTGSRAGMVCSILFIVFFLLFQAKKNMKTSKLLPYLFIFCAVFTYFTATTLADNQKVNEILTSRPSLINGYLNSEYIPKPFGSDAVYNKAEYQTPPLDNFSIYVLGKYGVVGFVAMSLLFCIGIRRELSPKLRCLFIFVMLYGMFEAFFDIPAKNFLLPIFFYSATKFNVKRKLLP